MIASGQSTAIDLFASTSHTVSLPCIPHHAVRASASFTGRGLPEMRMDMPGPAASTTAIANRLRMISIMS